MFDALTREKQSSNTCYKTRNSYLLLTVRHAIVQLVSDSGWAKGVVVVYWPTCNYDVSPRRIQCQRNKGERVYNRDKEITSCGGGKRGMLFSPNGNLFVNVQDPVLQIFRNK